MRLTFLGGAGEVTGSRHLVECGGFRMLLDCGLFQGRRQEAIEKNRRFPFPPNELDAVLLSHAHIDHSGGLPLLSRLGFTGPIYSTPATRDLCRLMLADSGRLQENDAEFFNRLHRSDGRRIEPLYTEADAEQVVERFKPQEYRQPLVLGEKIWANFFDAGHVLGSGMIEVDLPAKSGRRRILFTGDLGRRYPMLMQPQAPPHGIDDLIIESTYGNQRHEPFDGAEAAFEEIIRRAVEEQGKVLIPTFALERTQEVVLLLERLRQAGKIPEVPVYV